ncbi:MAG: MFS transporter [Burkholderiaceae bacterium]|jgi:MFS family permease|nr:MFS transporter [Burkholderiaceae bacterium]
MLVLLAPLWHTFRSLRHFNYRAWAAGALVSNIGTWMQRTAQDWLVLTQLTPHSAAAVGITMSLQFGPALLLLPWTGFAADHYNQRRMLMMTQAALGLLALVLGTLTLTGAVQLWHVYVLAFLQGCTAAFDAPVRQTFVGELVGIRDLPNAVALNSTSFNAGRMIGPAVAGLVIASVGTGWAFVINGLSFGGVLTSLALLRKSELRPNARATRANGSLLEGVRYVLKHPELKANLIMLFFFATFGMNFPIFISTMAVQVFHTDARGYGVLSSAMALGTIAGGLLAAGSEPRFTKLMRGAAVFALGCTLAAIAPGYWLFAGALVLTGMAALTFNNTSNSLMQINTEAAMRGRVMALRLAINQGFTPLGAPLVGGVADYFGPRWALGVGTASGLIAAAIALWYLRMGKVRWDK